MTTVVIVGFFFTPSSFLQSITCVTFSDSVVNLRPKYFRFSIEEGGRVIHNGDVDKFLSLVDNVQ